MKWINKADGLMRYRVEGEKGTPRALISVTWILKRPSLACILQNLWKPLGWTVRSICIQGWKSPYRIWTLYWAIQTALTQSLSKSIFFFFFFAVMLVGEVTQKASMKTNQLLKVLTPKIKRGVIEIWLYLYQTTCTCAHMCARTHTHVI